MAVVPQILVGQNLIVGGLSFQGEIPKFTQPKLTTKTEEHRAGGMYTPIELAIGMEKMEASFVATGVRPELLKLYGLADHSSFDAAFRGTFRGAGGVEVGTIATVRGLLKEVDPGEWGSGEKAEFKYAVAVSYYKLEVGGQVMHEIDPINAVCIIDGVDQLAQYRANLGI